MKLYFSPGACSLSPHISLREAGVPFELAQVDLRSKEIKTGGNFRDVNAKGMVPVLELDNGDRLTEGPAIVQYVADRNPAAGLAPAAGTIERYHLMEWLNFTTSELHKNFTPLFKPNTPEDYKKIARDTLAERYQFLDGKLAGKQYIMGDHFTVADAYLFTITNWTRIQKIELTPWPNVQGYMERVRARPKVQEAMKAEGLIR
ncbi:MAG TPA: glutathione transferase GstA [Stellaceae bacterium]|nr:glutathione transferase GstA [Stellaceae bacterium]